MHIIIDSIADIMSHEDKDLGKIGELAIQILFETISIVLRDKLKVNSHFLDNSFQIHSHCNYFMKKVTLVVMI